MSRRARALAFLAAAFGCAALAVLVANGYRSGVEAQLGELRSVVVAETELQPDRVLTPEQLKRSLGARRVPARFAPPGALRRPEEALGLEPQAVIPAGSYVLAAQLRVPRSKHPRRRRLGRGRRAVEIAVSGGAALMVSGGSPEGERVDVVVAEHPEVGGRGHTYVAASGVRLLALDGPGGLGTAGTWSATLALTRGQALQLIAAESFARQIRLLPRG
jgi:pilus assembly protein CpaB